MSWDRRDEDEAGNVLERQFRINDDGRVVRVDDEGREFITLGSEPLNPYAHIDLVNWVNPHERKRKDIWRYSYSEFFHFGTRNIIKQPDVFGNYSDRLAEFDYVKFDRLVKEHLPRGFRSDRAALSAFLSAYFGRPCTVVALAEGCNPSSGYPYFVVWHKEVKP